MPGVESCRVEGEDRILVTMGMEITERLVSKDDAARVLTYSITNGPKSAASLRLRVAQDDDADRYQNKGEQRTDIRQVRERANVENPARNANQESSNPSCGSWRAKSRMHPAEQFGQQAIARHREPNPQLGL